MPGHDVDVFMHVWSEVGYVPKNDWDSTNKKCDANKLKDVQRVFVGNFLICPVTMLTYSCTYGVK